MADPFATAQDVADRWRPLNEQEMSRAKLLAYDSSALIRARFPGIDAQVANGQVDRDILQIVVAGMVKRAMIAPSDGVTQDSDTMGPFSHSQSYANPLGNVFLTKADMTLILGYIPKASSHGYANDTTQTGRTYSRVYGW